MDGTADSARAHEGALQRELQELVYVISHDLNEPLRMVTAYLQLLERRLGDDLDERAGEFLHFAKDGAQRMGAMLEALLLVSRAGTVELDLQDLDPAGHVPDGLEVDGPLPAVRADPRQLERVLAELTANARAAGATSVTLSAGAGGSLLVRDDGPGIRGTDAVRAFRPFGRLHAAGERTGAISDTGVGLPLCRRLAERMGGGLDLEAGFDGPGASFVLRLPEAAG